MERLISMVAYIKHIEKIWYNGDLSNSEMLSKIITFTNFISQKLELWMFVPCKFVDGVWVVLEEPEEFKRWLKALEINEFNYWAEGWEECREYQEAKDRVLFKGFAGVYNVTKNGTVAIVRNTPNSWNIELGFKNSSCKFKIIEDLVKYNLELTQTAKKQIGL